MTNPNQQRMQDQMRERKEEQLLFQRFQNVATLQLEQLSRQVQITKQSKASDDSNGFNIDAGVAHDNDLKLGEEEKKIISNMTGMGLKEGILASIASFIILRRGPKYIGRWVQRRHQHQQSPSSPFSSSNTAGGTSASSASYKLSDPKKLTNSTSNNPFHRAANANANTNHNEFPRPRGLFNRSIWFVFDSVLSIMVGANVSVAFTDKNAIRQQIVELPLVSGRSLTADALCDGVVEELRKVREENNPAFERLQKNSRGEDSTTTEPTAASYFMDGIVLFCENCERRRYFERRIGEESGLGKMVPVEIPSPGVPGDGPRLVVAKGGEEKVVDKDGIEDPFLEQFGQNVSWANDFDTDSNDSDQDRSI